MTGANVSLSSDELRATAAVARWEMAPERSAGLVVSTYVHLPSGVPLWMAEGGIEPADPKLLRAIVATCSHLD